MTECPRPDAHEAMIEFYGECAWCGAMETDRLVAAVDGTWMWVYAKDVHYGDRIGRHVITAATRREDGRVAVTFDDGKVIHEETVDFMFRVLRPFCQFEWEAAGPHEGCAEFAAPETFTCDATATIGVRWHDDYLDEDEVLLVCVDHLSDALRDVQAEDEPFPLAVA